MADYNVILTVKIHGSAEEQKNISAGATFFETFFFTACFVP
jgi:hypothetical protein